MKFWRAGLAGLVAAAALDGNGFAQAKPVAPATPEAAAEWAKTLPENLRGQTLYGILGGWAGSNPLEAANWWKKQASDEFVFGGDSIFEAWAKKNAKEALDWIRTSLPDERANQALNGVASGWAEVDPQAAAQWAYEKEEDKSFLLSSVISRWADGWGNQGDPSSAKNWCQKLPSGNKKMTALEALGQSWGYRQPTQALLWMKSLGKPEDKAAFLKGVARMYGWNNAESGIAWLEAVRDPQLKKAGVMGVVESWSQSRRDEAEKWVANLPEGDLKKAALEGLENSGNSCGMPVAQRRTLTFPTPPDLEKLLKAPVDQSRQDALVKYALEWFERDPDKATQWIAAKLKGYVLTKTAGAVARKWSQKNLAGAAEWVRQIPPFWRDFVAALGSEWAGENPQEKAKAVLEWPDNMRRHVILRGVVERWAQRDPAAALAWVQALPAGPTKTDARKGLIVGWMVKDEPGCRKYVESIPDPTEKQTALHYVMHGLARLKPKEALAFMDTLPDRGTGPPTYCLGKEWALVDPPAAAEWAKGLAEGAAKEQALQAILRQWVYVDAVQVANWAASLPEKESRTEALNAVMENWIDQNPQQGLVWAQSQPDSEKKAEGIAAAIRTWGQLEPQEAQKWVTGLKDEKLKKNLLEEAMPVPVANLVAGQEAPDFKASTLDGKPFQLSDYRGKYVLLDFWATWCGPCLAETPNLKKIHETFGKRDDFVLIGLSLDRDPEKPRAYLKENQCGWVDGFLGDWGKDKVTKKYGVQGIPSIWLIGPDGKIVHKGLRGERIYEALNSALQAKK